MPYRPPKIEKIYYTIGEVAALFSAEVSCIRYWTDFFDFIKPARNKKGNRLFTTKEIDQIRLVDYFINERGLTLQGVRKKMQDNPDDTIHHFEIIKKLQTIKSELLEMKNSVSSDFID